MTTAPQVAVVVAAFDPGPYLQEALRSLLAQSADRWECVVVDDGSKEDITWVADLDPRIAYVRQDNAGVSAARNRGIAETSASLVAFLDQDDLWYPEYLTAQLRMFDRPDVVLSSTRFEIVDGAGRRVADGFEGHNSSYADLLRGCGLHLSTVIARRDAIERVGGFRDFTVAQDWDLWLRIARGGGELARVERVLGAWRQHARNQSRDYVRLLRDARRILAEHDHPAARDGVRRVRHLSGAQAFDRARDSRPFSREFAVALAWAAWHAPAYVVRNLMAWQGGRRWRAASRRPPAS